MADRIPDVTTADACRIVRLDRARLNEAVSAGFLRCVPETVVGRARWFRPDDLLVLWYYRELVEDGTTRDAAGRIACAIADAARHSPEAPVIAFLEDYFSPGRGTAIPADQVPPPSTWGETIFAGTDIRKVTFFRVSKARQLIAHYAEVVQNAPVPKD